MPLMFLISGFAQLFFTRITPWILTLVVSGVVLVSDTAKDWVFWLLAKFAEIALILFAFVIDKLDLTGTVGYYFAQLDPSVLLFLGHLDVPAMLGILATGFTLRILRKLVLRF